MTPPSVTDADREKAGDWAVAKYGRTVEANRAAADFLAGLAAGRALGAAGATWVWTWEAIQENGTYIVCALNMAANGSGAFYLTHPGLMKGWQVSRLKPKCYAAMMCPELPASIRAPGGPS